MVLVAEISRCVGDLGLIPGMLTQLNPQNRVGDYQEFPGLQAVGGRAQHQAFFKRCPGFWVDAASGIKSLGGVTVLKGLQQGRGSQSQGRDPCMVELGN